MPLSLYKVGTNGRLALGDLVNEGDHYTAELEHDDDGNSTVVLTKVEIRTTGGRRATTATENPLDFS